MSIAITSFEEARKSDLQNERLPPTREEQNAIEDTKQKQAIAQAVEEVEQDKELNEVAEAFVKEDEKRRSLKGTGNKGLSAFAIAAVADAVLDE